MSKNDDDKALHRKAEEYRRAAEDKCYEYNETAEQDAIDEFESGETASFFRDNARLAIGVVVKKVGALKKGDAPSPISYPKSETLIRLLSDCTEPEYEEKDFNEDLSDEETIAQWENGELVDVYAWHCAQTDATALQLEFIEAFRTYAKTAASYAKHIGSASLLEWAMIIKLLTHEKGQWLTYIEPKSAQRAVELEKSAADRLALDKIIYELPPFKPQTAKKDAAKTKGAAKAK